METTPHTALAPDAAADFTARYGASAFASRFNGIDIPSHFISATARSCGEDAGSAMRWLASYANLSK